MVCRSKEENCAYIPRSSLKENIIKEKDSEGLVGHFSRDKTLLGCWEFLLATILVRYEEVCIDL